ncbi:MAG: LysM peptidoglycan-binding domain-containing protein, partial [Rudaea sp.]
MNSSLIDSNRMKTAACGCLPWLLIAAALWLTGCASEPAEVEDLSLDTSAPQTAQTPVRSSPQVPAGSYHVERGDTLFSIAFKRGLDYRDVAGWNGIAPPYKILAGQWLRLSPPGALAQVPESAAHAPITSASSPVVVSSVPPSSTSATGMPPAPATKNGALFEDVPSAPAKTASVAASEPAPQPVS